MTTTAARRTYLDQDKGWSVWDTVTNSRSFVRKCKETGIPFTGPMMKAIRDGKKFQTRRLTPFFDYKRFHALDEDPRLELVPADSWRKQKGQLCAIVETQSEVDDTRNVYYPSRYGQPGDILWCREDWMKARCPVATEGAPQCIRGPLCEDIPRWRWYAWHKDAEDPGGWPIRLGWRSPRFMPRWASRETLLLADIRVQRVGDISEEDCFAEGYDDLPYVCSTCHGSGTHPYGDVCSCEGGRTLNTQKPIEWYAALWDSIHGKRPGCSFKESPYVWALTFERIGGTEK